GGQDGGKGDVTNPEWLQNSPCAQWVFEAVKKNPDDPDVQLAATEVLKTWPEMSDRTSGCVMAYIMATLDPFLHGEVGKLVTGPSTLTPKDIVDRGLVVVIDVPVLRYRESGRLLQLVWKMGLQRHVLRR